MKDCPLTTAFVFMIVTFVLVLLASQIVGQFWYQYDEFEAKVESIDYYHVGTLLSSATKAVVEFDNGVVVDVWEVPKALRVGEIYKIVYRSPYFMKDPYLVVR